MTRKEPGRDTKIRSRLICILQMFIRCLSGHALHSFTVTIACHCYRLLRIRTKSNAGRVDKKTFRPGLRLEISKVVIDEDGGVEKIQSLQCHNNDDIYDKAFNILNTYWLDEDDTTLPSVQCPQSGFHFGGNDVSVPSGGFKFSRRSLLVGW